MSLGNFPDVNSYNRVSGQTNVSLCQALVLFVVFKLHMHLLCLQVSIKDNIMRKGNHTRSKKPKPFMCAICPQQFTTHWGLKLHERLHRGDYRFYCKVCNKVTFNACTKSCYNITYRYISMHMAFF